MEGLSFSFQIGSRNNRDNPNFENEYNLLSEWTEILEERYNHKFTIVSNSNDYTTLQPEKCLDLLRLKYGNAKWIKIFITNELSKELSTDSRFEKEKNKNQGYWKSELKDTDISKYFDVLDAAYSWLIKHKI